MTEPAGEKSRNVWAGVFHSWADANASLEKGREAFLSDRWIQRITGQLHEYRSSYAENGAALPPRGCNLPWVCSATGARTIVDFGGSSGWCYDYLKHTLTGQEISSYVIVEIERVVEYMAGSGLHQAPVKYVTSDAALGKCDVLYSNSVLQYCDSNAQLLDLVKRTDPGYVLLDDLAARGDEDYFSTQAYYDTTIPTRFLGWKRLMSDLASAGYTNILAAPYPAAIHGRIQPLPMENFSEEYRIRHSWSLLFSRSKSR